MFVPLPTRLLSLQAKYVRVATWEESAFVRECAGIHLGFEDTLRCDVDHRELFGLLVYVDSHRVHNNDTVCGCCRVLSAVGD